MKKKITIINGPNLNLTGRREQALYGMKSFESFLDELKVKYNNIDLQYYQSNVEGELINKLHQVGFEQHGIVINAGGYTHTSVAMGDAIKAIESPCVEVHLKYYGARIVQASELYCCQLRRFYYWFRTEGLRFWLLSF